MSAPDVSDPFAPPSATSDPDGEALLHGPWRLRHHVVAEVGATWPRRCARCNEPHVVNKPVVLTLTWTSLWALLALPLGGLAFLLIVLAARRRAKISVYFCPTHHSVHGAWAKLVFPATIVIMVATVFASVVTTGTDDWLVRAAVTRLACLALFFVPREPLRARWIEGRRVDVGGTGAAFRAWLAEWHPDRIRTDPNEIPNHFRARSGTRSAPPDPVPTDRR